MKLDICGMTGGLRAQTREVLAGSKPARVTAVALACAGAVMLAGCASIVQPMAPTSPYLPAAQAPTPYADFSATAGYKPVAQPGSQRRVAQTEAEIEARRKLLEYVGNQMAGGVGGRGAASVNQIMAHDARMRAKILEYVRTQPVLDWAVDPCGGSVTVIVRADLDRLRVILAEPNC